MKISYKWLKEFLDIDLPIDKFCDKLTMFGVEVEELIRIGEQYDNVVVGFVLEAEVHPNADKLTVCKVDVGDELPLQIICGAPNVAKDQFVPVAKIGAIIGDTVLKKVKLRGLKSFGMICSEKELNISDEHAGIMILQKEVKPGTPFSNALEIEDTVIDVEITPNRPDLLGMVGIARNTSAMLDMDYSIPKFSIAEIEEKSSENIRVKIMDSDLCPRYCARVIKNVEVKPSPDWIQKRLRAIGLRPINNIVDVTNYVLMEYGHPLHAFDLNDITGNKITVRRAKNDEKIILLDETEYKLNDQNLLITDEKGPLALAGIMGGLNSSIHATTTDIVLECAFFNPQNIRKTSTEYNLNSESSYRFERGMDPNALEKVIDRAAYLIQLTSGGKICSGIVDEYPQRIEPKKIQLRVERANSLLDSKISSDTIQSYLNKLEFTVNPKESFLEVEVPTFRPDVEREIDLIEEIALCFGYNKILPKYYRRRIEGNFRRKTLRKIRTHLINLGFFEVCNLSFSNPGILDQLSLTESDFRRNFVEISNPIGEQFCILRTTLLPDLLNNVASNIAQHFENFRLFELNRVYINEGGNSSSEPLNLTGIIVGDFTPEYWKEQQSDLSFFDAKGILESLFEIIPLTDKVSFVNSKQPYLDQSRAADVFIGKELIGSIGFLSKNILANFEIEKPCLLIDLNISKLLEKLSNASYSYKNIIKYPTVVRDIALIAPTDISMSKIVETIKSVKSKIIKNVELFDVYEGSQVEDFHRSLAFRIEFQSAYSTLTDNYVDKLFDKIVKRLTVDKKIQLRH